MLHQPRLEPRCVHVTDQPASKCRNCQHDEPLAEWREHWRWRRSQLDWTVMPTKLIYRGSGTTAPGVVLSVADTLTGRIASINLPAFSLYLADVVMQGIKHCEDVVFAVPARSALRASRLEATVPEWTS